MSNRINIDVARVNQAGTTIIDQAGVMYNALNDICDIVNNTSTFFQSEGGDETRRNFNTSAQQFTAYRDFIKEYGTFLQSYGGVHTRIDDEIARVASTIPKLG